MNSATFCLLIVLFFISPYHCSNPSCKTNCTTDETCWHESLAFHSAELVQQLFSFGSLAIHVDYFKREHSAQLNDSIEFIDKTLEKYLSNESSASNLTIGLFETTKKLLIDFCVNLTSETVETISDIPPLMCPASTCTGDKLSYMTMLIISALIAGSILAICVVQFFQTYKQAKIMKLMKEIRTPTNSSAINDSSSATQF